MSGLVDTVERALFGDCGVARGARVLVACSGGRDSVVLLYALAELAQAVRVELAVATVDHGLRGDGDEVARLLRGQCADLELPFRAVTVQLDPAVLHGRGVEAAAREARRAALLGVAGDLGCEVVALAHHHQDQAETVLMRALVGTGVRGLAAMRPRSGRFVRPMRRVHPAQLEGFTRERALRWLEDPSNAELRFLRNRVRHRVLPVVLEELGPSAVSQLARLADRCAADEAVLHAAAEQLRGGAGADGGVSAAVLRGAEPPLAARVLATLAHQLDPTVRLGEVHLEAGLRLLTGPDRSAGVDLPGELRWQRDGDRIRALRSKVSAPEPTEPVALPVPGLACWPATGITVNATVHGEHQRVGRGPAPGLVRAWFDLDRLTMPLGMHKFGLGSRMRPFGGPGSRKISDLMSEAGIPRRLRASWPMVGDARQLLWVPGVRASDAGRVTGATTRILDLEMGEIR